MSDWLSVADMVVKEEEQDCRDPISNAHFSALLTDSFGVTILVAVKSYSVYLRLSAASPPVIVIMIHHDLRCVVKLQPVRDAVPGEESALEPAAQSYCCSTQGLSALDSSMLPVTRLSLVTTEGTSSSSPYARALNIVPFS